MHAFDFIVLFFSFVYAAAIAHILATVGELVIEAKRVAFSWLNAGWMLVALLATASWWISTWDLHDQKAWPVGLIAFFFLMASGIYLLTRMVCPRIPHDGPLDLRAFHAGEGRKYMIWFGVLAGVSALTNFVMGQSSGIGTWLAQNVTVIPMTLASFIAGAFTRSRVVQFACLTIVLTAWAIYYSVLQPPLSG